MKISIKKSWKKILILGSGGLKIGQAGEFDYSGSQAIKALKQEGIHTVLVNPNIATVQTDSRVSENQENAAQVHMADTVYLQPLNLNTVTAIIAQEKPDGILLGFGGQTALNLGLSLEETGVLAKYGVEVLGTSVKTIRLTEDRELFKQALLSIQIKTPKSVAAKTVQEALLAAETIGYPIMMRSGFSLGGLGSGKIHSAEALLQAATEVLHAAPQILIEEYLLGWKEFEYEIVRDHKDNALTICNMENMDPMGIHTGESIVVAPAQTLSDREHQTLRNIALLVARTVNIIGECNIQFAVNPENGDYRVIEMNARLSRSSALASKATGYPLAFVAAKLALGYALPEIKNSVTQKTCAFFEPALDYIVVKIPRWDTHKLKAANRRIGTEMKSVGEVMAIGRSFPEALQKAVRMLNIGQDGLSDYPFDFTLTETLEKIAETGSSPIEIALHSAPIAQEFEDHENLAEIEKMIEFATDQRLFALYLFFLKGGSVERAQSLSRINGWFLWQISDMAKFEVDFLKNLKQKNTNPQSQPYFWPLPLPLFLEKLKTAKQLGFSDSILGKWLEKKPQEIREIRKKNGIIPYIKQIDTLAGEFDAETNYLYFTYHGCAHDISPSYQISLNHPALSDLSDLSALPNKSNKPNKPNKSEIQSEKSILILGSGPYAIGSSVEFDWCAVNTARTLRKLGKKVIMVNYNPETVSTDYDESDRLYFEELTLERISDIAEFEDPAGLIISVGGQIANNLAMPLFEAGFPILGTSPVFIDCAENREKFSTLLNQLGIHQPEWARVNTVEDAKAFIQKIGYPALLRPSYVLSGAAMNIVLDETHLIQYLSAMNRHPSGISKDYPVVISQFIESAKELEIDGVAMNGEIVMDALSEHIENAGVHSGDATLVLPPEKIYLKTIRRAKDIARKIVKALHIHGPFNIQFIAKNNDLMVIECNVRASRSFPFVSKVTPYHFIDIATRVLLNCYESGPYNTLELDHVAVKSPQFSYNRFKGADPVAHVEMASTGEVACIAGDLLEAFYLSWQSAGHEIKNKRVLLSLADAYKSKFGALIQKLETKGYEIFTTEGTHQYLSKLGIGTHCVFKIKEHIQPNITELITQNQVDLVIVLPSHLPHQASQETDGFQIRRLAIDHHIPLITNPKLAELLLHCLIDLDGITLKPKSWNAYHRENSKDLQSLTQDNKKEKHHA
jgi:carbamoylphosphate synthase large subunit